MIVSGSQFYEGKPQYSMDLTEAEIHLRPLYLQLKVRDKKKNYVIGVSTSFLEI